MPIIICLTVMDGRQPSSYSMMQRDAQPVPNHRRCVLISIMLQIDVCTNMLWHDVLPACGQQIAQCLPCSSLTSFSMLRHTVPDGYTF